MRKTTYRTVLKTLFVLMISFVAYNLVLFISINIAHILGQPTYEHIHLIAIALLCSIVVGSTVTIVLKLSEILECLKDKEQ